MMKSQSQLAILSLNEEKLNALVNSITSLSEKLMKEDEDGEEKIRFLLLDLQFYSNYFITLCKHIWWGISPQQLDLLNDKVKENKQMRIDLFNSIQHYHLHSNKISFLEKKLLFWKKHLLHNYSILLEAKSSIYVSPGNMAQFITNVSTIAFHLLRCTDDVADDKKQAIRILQGHLRFFKLVVELAESSEGLILSLLNCIQDYTCKVEVLLYRFWIGETQGGRRDPLLSALMERGINGDETCTIHIIHDVLKMSKKMLLGEGMAWVLECEEVDYLDGAMDSNSIWKSTIEWIYQIVDGDFSKELLDWISSLIVQWKSGTRFLHEYLTFLASFVSDLSFDMKLVVVRAATFLGLLYAFSFGDISEEVFANVNLQLSALVTCLNVIKAEVSLMKLLSHDSSLIILIMPQLKEIQVFLKFLREYWTDMDDKKIRDKAPLMLQSKAIVSETFSFLELLVEHEMEKDTSTEITLAVLKLLGTTKLIQAHVLALELLDCDKNVVSQMEVQLVKLCKKLGSLVGLMDNFENNNDNQVLFLLDAGALAIKAVSILSLFSMDITGESFKEGNTHLLKLIADIELLEAGLMLNGLFNHHLDIEALRNGFRLLRTILMDLTEPALKDKILLAYSVEWASEATQLISLLFDNRSNEVTMEMNDSVSLFLERMNDLEADVTAVYLEIRRSSHSAHPRTDILGFINCLLDNLNTLSSSMPTFSWMKYQIRRASKYLKSSRALLNNNLWEHNEDGKLNNLVSQLTQAAYEVEYVAEAILIGDSMTREQRLWISLAIDEIKQKSIEITGILANRPYNDNLLITSRHVLRPVDFPCTNEVVVGMKEQEEKAINWLTGGSKKLGIVSIVGMGGLGKTTLANKLFNTPLVRDWFPVRAWCCISQAYQERETLLELLGYVMEVTPEIRECTDDDLSHKLRNNLLRRTYLIVLDDVWDMGAWEDLKRCFPNDENRSRILLTSRSNDIASKTGCGFEICSLDLLSERECWELLERKLFKEGVNCPSLFREVGWEIAKNCKGLPLAVVVISGLLSAKKMNLDWWKQVAVKSKNFSNMIDLSYHYVPDYLKPCFLYLGTFQEDEKILVSNLIHLWTAEGFIQRNNNKNLNDAARDYLLELVNRNLVSVAERTSMGGIKACRVHGLLHELCRAKAEEERLLHVVKDLDNNSPSSSSSVIYEYHRLCIYSKRRNFIKSMPSGEFVRSLLYFAIRDDGSLLSKYDASFIFLNFKLLRALKLDSINIGDSLPDGIVLLVYLRFLAIRGTMTSIPDSIERLSILEFFSVKGLRGEISLPHSIWSLKRLRHLHVKDRFAFSSIERTLDELSRSDNLESLSSVFFPYNVSTDNILRRLSRSLKKLNCIFSESWNETENCNKFPLLNSLVQLEALKVVYHGRVRHPSVFSYPAGLKKLTLSKFRLPWKEISALGSLPCLEVLKLLFKAFEGDEWEVGSEEFQNLKYLKLDSLDIVRWTTSYESFPSLQQIVLQSCKQLEEFPFDFAESPSLQMIRVQWCSKTVVKSVRDIQMEHMDWSGSQHKLNVSIHPPDC